MFVIMQSSDSSSGTECVCPVGMARAGLDFPGPGMGWTTREYARAHGLMGYACPHFGKSVSCRSVSSLLVCSRCRGLMAFNAGQVGADVTVLLRAVTQHSLDGAGGRRRRGLDHGATQGTKAAGALSSPSGAACRTLFARFAASRMRHAPHSWAWRHSMCLGRRLWTAPV